jgi:hypothetical protein
MLIAFYCQKNMKAMKLIRKFSILPFFIIVVGSGSCHNGKYTCEFYSGCNTITVKYYAKDSVVAVKTVCTEHNMMNDGNYIDSCNAFKNKYASSLYVVTDNYSYAKQDRVTGVPPRKTKNYPEYTCGNSR